MNEKYTFLNNGCFAVTGNSYTGPFFGGGSDLAISNRANQDNSSYANFPHTFNYHNKYAANQAAHSSFSGAPNGYRFKISEWEVFEVAFSDDVTNI